MYIIYVFDYMLGNRTRVIDDISENILVINFSIVSSKWIFMLNCTSN